MPASRASPCVLSAPWCACVCVYFVASNKTGDAVCVYHVCAHLTPRSGNHTCRATMTARADAWHLAQSLARSSPPETLVAVSVSPASHYAPNY